MSVWFRAMAALILPVAVSGCGITCGCEPAPLPTPPPIVATVAPGDLSVPGTLTICSDLRRPPLEMVVDGETVGIDIMIGSGIAARLGLAVEVANTDKAAISAALSSDSCDIALSGLEIGSPDTAGLVMLPYGGLHQSIVVPNSNPHSIAGLADLCGRTVGVILGSDEAAALGSDSGASVFAVCGNPAPTVRLYATESDAADALTNRQVDSLFVDSATAGWQVTESSSTAVLFAVIDNVTSRVAEMGVAMRQGKPELQAAVQKALDAMNADGSLARDWHAGGNVDLPGASATP